VCEASPAAPRIRSIWRLIFGLVTSVYSRNRTDGIVVNPCSLSRAAFEILSQPRSVALRANFGKQINRHKSGGNDDGCEEEKHGGLERKKVECC
jgi:hypothetical protein